MANTDAVRRLLSQFGEHRFVLFRRRMCSSKRVG